MSANDQAEGDSPPRGINLFCPGSVTLSTLLLETRAAVWYLADDGLHYRVTRPPIWIRNDWGAGRSLLFQIRVVRLQWSLPAGSKSWPWRETRVRILSVYPGVWKQDLAAVRLDVWPKAYWLGPLGPRTRIARPTDRAGLRPVPIGVAKDVIAKGREHGARIDSRLVKNLESWFLNPDP